MRGLCEQVHLPMWERLGVSYREYSDTCRKTVDRACDLVRAGAAQADALSQARTEIEPEGWRCETD